MKSLMVVVFALLVPGLAAAQWQGSEITEDGARVVKNPEKAVENSTVELEELWRRGDEDDDIFFGLPSAIVHDADGLIYVLDSQVSEIHVFAPDGEFVRTIGREGDGPGEFRGSNDMYFGPGGVIGVVRVFPGKIVQLNPDGTPADDFRLPADEGEGFQLVFKAGANPDRVVVCGAKQTQDGSKQTQLNYLKAFDKDGKELAHFHDMNEHTQYGGMKFDEKIFANFKGQWSLADDGRVAAVLAFDDYRVHVWNPDGSLSHIIERPEYAPLERTGEELDRYQKLYDGFTRWSPGSSFKVSATHRAVYNVWFRPDGSLWALSGSGLWGRDEGVFAAFDVYDRQGRFMQRVELRGDGDPENDSIYFAGDRFYRVSDSFSALMAQIGGDTGGDGDEDPLQLIAYDLGTAEMGMR